MRRTGPRAFWLSFFITLGVVLPLMGSFALYAVWQKEDAAPAQQPHSGVPVRTPGPGHAGNILVTVAGETPAFVLLRLDAVQNTLVVEALPGQSVLLSPSGPVLLADSYAAAGPARAAALLGGTLGITIDRYLAITPETLVRALEEIGPVRLNLTGLLSEEEQTGLGLAGPVQEYTPETAAAFLAGMDGELSPERAAALRAALWEAWLRQNLDLLPAALPDGLRAVSSRLLTDLTASDLYLLGQTLNFLAAGRTGARILPDDPAAGGEEPPAEEEGALRVVSGVLPGHWDQRTGRYEFSEETAALAAQLFGKTASSPDGTGADEESAADEKTPDGAEGESGPDEKTPDGTADKTAGAAPENASAAAPAGQPDTAPEDAENTDG